MPPQKQTRPSMTESLRCSRRQRCGSSTRQPRAGLKTRHCTPAACQRRCHSAGIGSVPMPSTTTRTLTPRAAARSSAAATSAASAAELEDVGLEQDLGAGRVDRLDERGEERRAAAQQLELVAGPERPFVRSAARFGHGAAQAQASSSSATSGRWSDMRAQAAPRGTEVERHWKPRV